MMDLIIVDDDGVTRRLLELKARDFGFRPLSFDRGEEVLESIHDGVKAVLVDLRLPGMSGFDLLERLSKCHPGLPCVVLTAANKVEDAVKAMKLGAFDYLTKPFDPAELFGCLTKAARMRAVQRENEDLREMIGTAVGAPEIVAESPAMIALLERARRVAELDSTVLLTGESGVGKGQLARYIHAYGRRAAAPFMTVSCPALPRELLESELFGHEKGAFTGAAKRRIGRIEAARGGTLFLDEIGDLPLDLQPKLLNVLQDREFQRVGGTEWIKADFRLVAATNIDFADKIRRGLFREDLYYRLSVIPMEIPSLRERPEDLPPLSMRILANISRRRGPGRAIRLSAEAQKLMGAHRWPGNVRELENVLELASAFCSDGVVRGEDLPAELQRGAAGGQAVATPGGLLGLTLEQLEMEAIRQTLAASGGNKAEAARRLGIAEKSIYNKMKRYGILPSSP